jgi:hypothetical protein
MVLPGYVGHVESLFFLFGDSANPIWVLSEIVLILT